MKNILKSIIIFKLRIFSKILLWRKKPRIFAITGSAGKTSTKEFLATFLKNEYSVMAPSEGYNTDIGATLALFKEKAPRDPYSFRTAPKWAAILMRAGLKTLTMKDFPEILVVEMGADKPGDIRYLTSIFKPELGIILSVLPVHLLEFGNIENIAAEKTELAAAIKSGGKLIINADDEKVLEMAKSTNETVITFGKRAGSDYEIKNLKSDLKGLSFELENKGQTYKFNGRLYGEHMVYPLAASIVAAAEEGVSFEKIAKTVATLKPFKGRMNVLEGINGSVIIDDSYNANPQSMVRALEFLSGQSGRKIALLGNMNELGDYEKEGHETVGREAAKSADMLLTVGELARDILAKEAVVASLSAQKVHSFMDPEEAGKWLKKKLKAGDIVLVKGSQNKVRLEKAVREIMAHPDEAPDVLVRQSSFWKDR